MTDPVKEAVERLEDDLSRAREDGLVLTDAPRLRTALAELSRLSRLVEEAGEERETLRMIANRARHEPHDGAYADEPPDWALDPFNGDCADQCGYCGSWMTCVRPGKTQCDSCSDGQDLGAIARASLTHKAISGGGE